MRLASWRIIHDYVVFCPNANGPPILEDSMAGVLHHEIVS